MSKKPTAGIILAAGMSTRFGSLKPLARVGDKNIISMVVKAAVDSELDHTVLVLGYMSDKILAETEGCLEHPKLSIVINHQYMEGMSSSLKLGLEKVKDEYPSIMVILGDQPLLEKSKINIVLKKFRFSDKGICMASCKGVKGHPACFSKKFYDDILRINGDMGARDIIRNNPDHLLLVEMDNPDFFTDIDNKADLEKVISMVTKRENNG